MDPIFVVKQILFVSALVVLAGCATAPAPSDRPTPSPASATASLSVILPELDCSPNQYWRPPLLTCEMAVAAALGRAITTSPEAIRFEYGFYCSPYQGCPASIPDVGYVVIEQGGWQGDVFVTVRLEDSGRELVAVAGPVREFPPRPEPGLP